jgi:hypothetical protein
MILSCKLDKNSSNKKRGAEAPLHKQNNQEVYTAPCANMASATLTKPPILAPFT